MRVGNQPALLRFAQAELRRAGKKSSTILCGPEINLPFLEVDLQDGDAEVGTGPKGFAGAATPQGALGGIEGEEIVLDGANVDQAGEQKVR